MIKLFRKNRQNLLMENKIWKYFKYAIGEILLVVLGILIALYINNTNHDYQIEKKTTSLMNEVAKDLEYFITVSNNQLEFYSNKQKIFDLIINEKLTYEDYSKSRHPKLTVATTWYLYGEKRQIAYKNLISEINEIPDKYKSLVNALSSFYDNKVNEDYTKLIKSISIENEKKRVNNYKWYSSKVPDNQNNEMIDFMLNDFRYKNEAKYYYQLVSHHIEFILKDKIRAQKILEKIDNLLNNSLEKNNFGIDLNSNNILIGKWTNSDYPNFEISISNNDNKLFYQTSIDSTKFELNPISDKLFIDNNYMFWKIEKTNEEVKIRIVNLELNKSEE
jgi:hypothetical protein